MCIIICNIKNDDDDDGDYDDDGDGDDDEDNGDDDGDDEGDDDDGDDFGGLGCSQRLPLSVWVVPATLRVPVAGWPKKRELGPLSSGY